MTEKQPEIKQQIKDLKALKTQVETYRKTADTYKKYTAPGQLKYFKTKYYDKHKTDIEAHKKAKAYIYDELKLTKFPNLKKLSGDIAKLTAEEKGLLEALPTAKEKYNSLKVATNNSSMLLGYRELELQDRHPSATIQNRVDIPVYKSTYNNAKNKGKVMLYFQNQHLNHECAEAIRNTVWQNMNATQNKQDDNQLANSFISQYGAERVGHVIDTPMVNVKNEDLSFAIYKIKKAVKLASAEIIWDRGERHLLSHEDAMAVAKKKSDDHNHNRTNKVQHKPSRDNGMNL